MKGIKFIKIFLMVFIIFSLVSTIVMLLWNWLIPDLFELSEITIWQAAGILLLSKILFGGFKKGHHGHDGPPWKKHWQKKWHSIPEDKRERWKQRFADKWCGYVSEEQAESEIDKKDGE